MALIFGLGFVAMKSGHLLAGHVPVKYTVKSSRYSELSYYHMVIL